MAYCSSPFVYVVPMSEDPELDQQVDQLVTSLLREYLVRRCFFDVLRLFDFETGARDACLTTPALVTSLRLSRLYKRNAASGESSIASARTAASFLTPLLSSRSAAQCARRPYRVFVSQWRRSSCGRRGRRRHW